MTAPEAAQSRAALGWRDQWHSESHRGKGRYHSHLSPCVTQEVFRPAQEVLFESHIRRIPISLLSHYDQQKFENEKTQPQGE